MSDHKPASLDDTAEVPSSEELTALLKRIEAASGADREIDAALHNALCAGDFLGVAFHTDDRAFHELSRYHDGWLVGRSNTDEYAENLPRYTGSIDAAISLLHRVLREDLAAYDINYSTLGGPHCARVVVVTAEPKTSEHIAHHEHRGPRALCVALLKARLADEGTTTVSPRKLQNE